MPEEEGRGGKERKAGKRRKGRGRGRTEVLCNWYFRFDVRKWSVL